ncbi:MAG: ABC transporter permease [Mariprofundaceae bacterium]|nr:ABC transporter permease [Mariprofundaceae bacterium]
MMRRLFIFISLSIPFLLLIAGYLHPANAYQVDLDQILAPASWSHPLGCDELGRDVLARMAQAICLSLSISLAVIIFGGSLGISIGIVAAWYGGIGDTLLMRLADIILSFPGILLAIALAAMLGPGIDNLFIALLTVGWVGFARLSRAQVLSLKNSAYIQAAIACGSSLPSIAFRHLLPNIAAPLLVEASFGLAAVMIAEAGLSFLGVGVQPPTASLGSMIREGTRFLLIEPWLVIWPGLVLFMLVMAINLWGDHLRDKLDVRMHP